MKLENWFIVWRPVGDKGQFGAKNPVAAFATKAMAEGWILEAPHRREDWVEPIETLKDWDAQPQR